MQVGDSAAHGTPCQVLLRASFFGAIDAEIFYVVDGRFPAQPMLDPHPFLAPLHIAGQLGRKPPRHLAAERNTAA